MNLVAPDRQDRGVPLVCHALDQFLSSDWRGPAADRRPTDSGRNRTGSFWGFRVGKQTLSYLRPETRDGALEYYGDARALQGHWRDAFVKYDQALSQAPGWQGLKQARDLGAKRL